MRWLLGASKTSNQATTKNVSEYDQEIPQSQNADNPVAPRGKAAQPSRDTRKTIPGRIAQSVTCLVTDACLTAIPGVASSIPARSHTFMEIDHEIISTIILLRSADSFKKGCCQLQAEVCAQITG